MLASLGVLKPFREAEVNEIADSSLLLEAHQEVVRLHVSVDEVVVLHELYSSDHLVSQHAYSLKSKLPSAVLEKVF